MAHPEFEKIPADLHMEADLCDQALAHWALSTLPLGLSDVVIWRFWQEMPVHQIAGILGITSQGVYARLSKAVCIMRSALAEDGYGTVIELSEPVAGVESHR